MSQIVNGDIQAQTADVLEQTDQALERAGSDKGELLSAQIWLKDMADYAAIAFSFATDP